MMEKICCFTGHRPGKLDISEEEVKNYLETAVLQAVQDGYTTFISGMAPGTDIIAAEIVLRLRMDNPTLKVVCAMPYRGFGQRWKNGWSERMQTIVTQADEVKYVCDSASRSSYQQRNQWMVDHSSRVIALYNGTKGGTRNTIEYARKKGIPCVILAVK